MIESSCYVFSIPDKELSDLNAVGRLGIVGDGEIFWKGKYNVAILKNGDWLASQELVATEGNVLAQYSFAASVEGTRGLQRPFEALDTSDAQRIELFYTQVDTGYMCDAVKKLDGVDFKMYENYLLRLREGISLDLFNFSEFGGAYLTTLGITPVSDFIVSCIVLATYHYFGEAVGIHQVYPLTSFYYGRVDNRRTFNKHLL